MITKKAIETSLRIDKLARREFGAAYTLKTTFWNDGDFRVTAYSYREADPSQLPGDAKEAYVELRYQDSKLEDGTAFMVRTAQDDFASREDTEQYELEEGEFVDLPEVDYGSD